MLSGLGDHSQHGGLRLLISPLPLRAFLKVHGECHSACGGQGGGACPLEGADQSSCPFLLLFLPGSFCYQPSW